MRDFELSRNWIRHVGIRQDSPVSSSGLNVHVRMFIAAHPHSFRCEWGNCRLLNVPYCPVDACQQGSTDMVGRERERERERRGGGKEKKDGEVLRFSLFASLNVPHCPVDQRERKKWGKEREGGFDAFVVCLTKHAPSSRGSVPEISQQGSTDMPLKAKSRLTFIWVCMDEHSVIDRPLISASLREGRWWREREERQGVRECSGRETEGGKVK